MKFVLSAKIIKEESLTKIIKDYTIGEFEKIINAIPSFFENEVFEIKGKVEQGATLKGEISIGENTIVLSGSYIQGPVYIGDNCRVGPNCNIRHGVIIGDNCHVGQASEIKNSIIMSNTDVPHLNYVGDSVVGTYCNLGAGTKLANLRFDEKNIRKTDRNKLGAMIGDYTKTGINVSIMPGVIIGPNLKIMLHTTIYKDVLFGE